MEDFHWVSDQVNNRQIAIGIWLLAVLIYFIACSRVRESLWAIVKTLFNRELIELFGCFAATVVASCRIFFIG